MKKRSGKKMHAIIGTLLIVLGFVTVFFNISHSKTRAVFTGITGDLLTQMAVESGVFTEEDINDLLSSVQKYF